MDFSLQKLQELYTSLNEQAEAFGEQGERLVGGEAYGLVLDNLQACSQQFYNLCNRLQVLLERRRSLDFDAMAEYVRRAADNAPAERHSGLRWNNESSQFEFTDDAVDVESEAAEEFAAEDEEADTLQLPADFDPGTGRFTNIPVTPMRHNRIINAWGLNINRDGRSSPLDVLLIHDLQSWMASGRYRLFCGNVPSRLASFNEFRAFENGWIILGTYSGDIFYVRMIAKYNDNYAKWEIKYIDYKGKASRLNRLNTVLVPYDYVGFACDYRYSS